MEEERKKKKEEEEEEIVSSISRMNVKGWDLLRLLDSIQNSTVELRPVKPAGNSDAQHEGDTPEILPDFDEEDTGFDNQTPDEALESEE